MTRPRDPDLPAAVRRATPIDAPAIADLHVRAWRTAYRGLVPDAVLDGMSVGDRTRRWERILAPHAEGGASRESVWVSEVGRALLGFVAAGPARDESAPPPEGAGEVTTIYVEPTTIGRGVGRDLLTEAVETLRSGGFDPIVVWVFEANARARRFYEAAGFRPDGARYDIDFGGGAIVPEIRYRLDAQSPTA